MKRVTTIYGTLLLALVFSSLGAAPLAAGEQCDEALDVCVREMIDHLRKRGWVGLELETESADGILITKVITESPADRAGLQKGDLLTAVNGVGYERKNQVELKKMYGAMVPGGEVTYSVTRGSEHLEVTVTLAPMPETVIAQWIGFHILNYHQEEVVTETEDGDKNDTDD